MTRVGVLKIAVTIGLAGVALIATPSLATADSLERAPTYVRGPRIIHIPEREPASSNEDVSPTSPPASRLDALSAPPPLSDGPTPIRPMPRSKVKADSAATNSSPRGD